jgi:peptidoglycan/LPS O-acetylase OafA/YrhL
MKSFPASNAERAGKTPPETKQQLEPVRFEFADALRGIAVLGVVLVHTHQNFASYYPIQGIRFGMYGVQLFYIVSAFSLVLSFMNRSGREVAPLRNYFVGRLSI